MNSKSSVKNTANNNNSTKRDMTRLEAAEMRFLRSVKGYTRLGKIRSEVI